MIPKVEKWGVSPNLTRSNVEKNEQNRPVLSAFFGMNNMAPRCLCREPAFNLEHVCHTSQGKVIHAVVTGCASVPNGYAGRFGR